MSPVSGPQCRVPTLGGLWAPAGRARVAATPTRTSATTTSTAVRRYRRRPAMRTVERFTVPPPNVTAGEGPRPRRTVAPHPRATTLRAAAEASARAATPTRGSRRRIGRGVGEPVGSGGPEGAAVSGGTDADHGAETLAQD